MDPLHSAPQTGVQRGNSAQIIGWDRYAVQLQQRGHKDIGGQAQRLIVHRCTLIADGFTLREGLTGRAMR